MQKYKILAMSAIILSVLFIGGNVKAQDIPASDLDGSVGVVIDDVVISGATSLTPDQVLAESTDLAEELEPLEGVEIKEPTSIPSGFGIWWQNLKETVSLGLTFNPVKKAEKQLKFAEERMKLAEYMMQNSTDTKVQEKAQQMIERANGYIQKIEEKKSNLVASSDQKIKTLFDNVAKHYLNKEKVLERIEDKISPEKLEQFQQVRVRIEEKREEFLNYLENNSNVPQEVKDKVSGVVQRIEAIKLEREEFREGQKDLLEQIKAGSQEARVELENLREEKKQATEQLREQYKENKIEIINKIKEGDSSAVDELKKLNEEQKMNALQIIQNVQEKAGEIRGEVKEQTGELRQELEQNRDQIKQQIQQLNTQVSQ